MFSQQPTRLRHFVAKQILASALLWRSAHRFYSSSDPVSYFVLDDKLLKSFVTRTSPGLTKFIEEGTKTGKHKIYTTWLAETALREIHEITKPIEVEVIGKEVKEEQLATLYRNLLNALPKAKHTRREGKNVDLSYIVDHICSVICISMADIPEFDSLRGDKRSFLVDDNDNFPFHSWITKPENFNALKRVLNDARIPICSVDWASDLGVLDIVSAFKANDGGIDFHKASGAAQVDPATIEAQRRRPLSPEELAVKGEHDVYNDFALSAFEVGLPPKEPVAKSAPAPRLETIKPTPSSWGPSVTSPPPPTSASPTPSSQTSSTSISPDPATSEVSRWTKAQVREFVMDLPFEDQEDRDQVLEMFTRQKVNGKTLVAYTVDSLMADGLPRGTAVFVLDYVKLTVAGDKQKQQRRH